MLKEFSLPNPYPKHRTIEGEIYSLAWIEHHDCAQLEIARAEEGNWSEGVRCSGHYGSPTHALFLALEDYLRAGKSFDDLHDIIWRGTEYECRTYEEYFEEQDLI